MSIFGNLTCDEIQSRYDICSNNNHNIKKITESMNYFHNMLVPFFRDIMKKDLYIDLLITCPSTKDLMVKSGIIIMKDPYEYEKKMFEKDKMTKKTYFDCYLDVDDFNYTICSKVEEYILNQMKNYQYYGRSWSSEKLCEIFNESHNLSYLTVELFEKVYNVEHDIDNVVIKWFQYNDQHIKYMNKSDGFTKFAENKLNMYFDEKELIEELIEESIGSIEESMEDNGKKFLDIAFEKNDISTELEMLDMNDSDLSEKSLDDSTDSANKLLDDSSDKSLDDSSDSDTRMI